MRFGGVLPSLPTAGRELRKFARLSISTFSPPREDFDDDDDDHINNKVVIGNRFFIDDDHDHDTDKEMQNVSVSFESNQMGLCLPNLFQREWYPSTYSFFIS